MQSRSGTIIPRQQHGIGLTSSANRDIRPPRTRRGDENALPRLRRDAVVDRRIKPLRFPREIQPESLTDDPRKSLVLPATVIAPAIRPRVNGSRYGRRGQNRRPIRPHPRRSLDLSVMAMAGGIAQDVPLALVAMVQSDLSCHPPRSGRPGRRRCIAGPVKGAQSLIVPRKAGSPPPNVRTAPSVDGGNGVGRVVSAGRRQSNARLLHRPPPLHVPGRRGSSPKDKNENAEPSPFATRASNSDFTLTRSCGPSKLSNRPGRLPN